MASPLSPGAWDLDPVRSSVRFRVFAPVGGFVNGRFDELRGRVAVDEDGAIQRRGRAATAASVAAPDGNISRSHWEENPAYRPTRPPLLL
jgi:hypothetical protein